MKVHFVASEPIARNTISFYFKPGKQVDYTAGQFIDLTIPHEADRRGNRRWFTLSSSPSEEHLAITTRLNPNEASSFKRALYGLKPGDEVMMSDPMGDFVLPKDATIPVTFVAGGIGITPVRSMMKWMLDSSEKRPVNLIYAVTNEEEIAFDQIFTSYGLKKDIVVSRPSKEWPGPSGRLDARKVLDITPDSANRFYYLSGPEPLIEELVTALADLGVERSRLVTDFFLNYTSI